MEEAAGWEVAAFIAALSLASSKDVSKEAAEKIAVIQEALADRERAVPLGRYTYRPELYFPSTVIYQWAMQPSTLLKLLTFHEELYAARGQGKYIVLFLDTSLQRQTRLLTREDETKMRASLPAAVVDCAFGGLLESLETRPDATKGTDINVKASNVDKVGDIKAAKAARAGVMENTKLQPVGSRHTSNSTKKGKEWEAPFYPCILYFGNTTDPTLARYGVFKLPYVDLADMVHRSENDRRLSYYARLWSKMLVPRVL